MEIEFLNAILLFWIYGILSVVFPFPKNLWVGYRTKKSLKSNAHWVIAQKLFGVSLVVLCSLSVLVRVFVLGGLQDAFAFAFLWVDVILIVVLSILLTEVLLERMLMRLRGWFAT